MDKEKGQVDKWLRTDEIGELTDAISHSAELALRVRKDAQAWKWLIVALHNALQGACVCALRGSDTTGTSVLKKRSAMEILNWLDVDTRRNPHLPMPNEELASLLDLYARVGMQKYLQDPHRLPSNRQMELDVKKLNSLRNIFIHFVPKSFSLEISGLPRITHHCCDAIEHLAITHPTFWHRINGNQKRRMAAALQALRENTNL